MMRYFARIETEAMWFSHSSWSLPVLPLAVIVYFSFSMGIWRLLHFHVDAAQIHAGIVGIAVLTGLFIDDELPVFGVLHQDVKRIGAGRHIEAGDVEIGPGLERGGGIRAGAPYGIGRIPRHHAAISKDLAAAHRGRGVLNRDGFAGYGGGCLGGRALG